MLQIAEKYQYRPQLFLNVLWFYTSKKLLNIYFRILSMVCIYASFFGKCFYRLFFKNVIWNVFGFMMYFFNLHRVLVLFTVAFGIILSFIL